MRIVSRRRFFLAGLCAASAARAAGPHPAFFLPNRGQFDGGLFGADLPRWQATFSARGAAFRAKRLVGDPGPLNAPVTANARESSGVDLDLALIGASAIEPVGEDRRRGRSDFFFHGDPKTFIRNLPHFYRLRYRDVWPGVDLVFRVWERTVRMTPIVRTGSGLAEMAFRWRGASPRKSAGGVVLSAGWGAVRQAPPEAPDGSPIAGAYRLEASGLLRFQ